MESQFILVSETRSTPSNGYGTDADQTNPHTQFLNVWAKFYQQDSDRILATTKGKKSQHKDNNYFPSFKEIFLKDSKGNQITTMVPVPSKNPNQKKNLDEAGNPVMMEVPAVLPDFVRVNASLYISETAYKRRIQISVETFLFLANDISTKTEKQVYCHAIGLGLGSWQVKRDEQNQWTIDVFHVVLQEYFFAGISDVDFSWFHENVTSCGGIADGEFLKGINSHIKVHISKRNTADPLDQDSKDKLLVSMYAWYVCLQNRF